MSFASFRKQRDEVEPYVSHSLSLSVHRFLSDLMRLVLASASPQRRTLLEGLGVTFEVIPSSVDEEAYLERDPVKRSRALAKMKAADVAARHPRSTVIGCDTLVVAADGTLLEKPKNADDARRMIELQSGTVSTIHSALCLIDEQGKVKEGLSTSRVRFKKLSGTDIKWWIETERWKGRSGAFQIDGQGQLIIEHLDGDWTGVVGLPVFLLGMMLQELFLI